MRVRGETSVVALSRGIGWSKNVLYHRFGMRSTWAVGDLVILAKALGTQPHVIVKYAQLVLEGKADINGPLPAADD